MPRSGPTLQVRNGDLQTIPLGSSSYDPSGGGANILYYYRLLVAQIVFAEADFSIQSAAMSGLSSLLGTISQELPFACPSRNCTWDGFDSLSVCSQCNDVSSQLRYEKLNSDSGAFLLNILDQSNPGLLAGNGTAAVLPNGHVIANLDRQSADQSGPYSAILMTFYGTGNASDTTSFRQLQGKTDTLIWSTSLLKTRSSSPPLIWPDSNLEAIECALYYCVNHYQSAVLDGVLQEVVTPVQGAARSPLSWDPIKYPYWWSDQGNSPLNDTMLDSIGFDRRFSIIGRSDLALVSGSDDGQFNLSQTAVDSISSFFQASFAANPTWFFNIDAENSTASLVNASETASRLNGYYLNATEGPQYRPSLAQALWSPPSPGGNLSATFAGVAQAMTNALRAGADNSTSSSSNNNNNSATASTVHGRLGQQTTYYRIE